jgi:hypothetical protein
MGWQECAIPALAAVLVVLIIILIMCVTGSHGSHMSHFGEPNMATNVIPRPDPEPKVDGLLMSTAPIYEGFQGSPGDYDDFKAARVGGATGGAMGGATGGAMGAPRNLDGHPYVKINNFIDKARGMSASELAGHSLPPWQVPGEIERYYQSKMDWKKPCDQPERFHQSGVTIDPEQAAAADQELWVSNLDSSSVAPYNTERAFDSSHDATGYHESAPLDYNTHITENVLDAHAVSNHHKWASSMMPWAGTSMSPDTLDEALEASTHFVGLRRPQAIAQHNSLQVTERDMYTFLGNAKFNFLG